jgi:hypothetical protein
MTAHLFSDLETQDNSDRRALRFRVQEQSSKIHHKPVKILMNFPAWSQQRAPAPRGEFKKPDEISAVEWAQRSRCRSGFLEFLAI